MEVTIDNENWLEKLKEQNLERGTVRCERYKRRHPEPGTVQGLGLFSLGVP